MKYFYTIVFLIVATGCATENYPSILGKDPHMAFSNDQFDGEWLIDIKGQTLDAQWSMSLIKEESDFLVVASYNNASNSDNPKWIIRSAKKMRLLNDEETIATGTCELNGESKPNIVAIVKYESDKEWFTDVKYAVLFDENHVKFTEIPGKNLQCVNEGYEEDD